MLPSTAMPGMLESKASLFLPILRRNRQWSRNQGTAGAWLSSLAKKIWGSLSSLICLLFGILSTILPSLFLMVLPADRHLIFNSLHTVAFCRWSIHFPTSRFCSPLFSYKFTPFFFSFFLAHHHFSGISGGTSIMFSQNLLDIDWLGISFYFVTSAPECEGL